jgi:VIT1/CCC1 family predicted Fe2+/Mn2+ transporter
VLGLTDGIMNALVLASAAIVHPQNQLSLMLGVRVGAAALATSVFTIFVATYSDLRSQLARSSQQLNIASPGYLATTKLGRAVIREALAATVIASIASCIGAVFPLAAGALLPGPSWIPLAIAIAALAGMGGWIGAEVGGSKIKWAGWLALGGTAVAVVGVQLHIT